MLSFLFLLQGSLKIFKMYSLLCVCSALSMKRAMANGDRSCFYRSAHGLFFKTALLFFDFVGLH